MMDPDGTNSVALVGLSNHDLSLIRSLLKLSVARERKYRAVEGAERQAADVFVVNGDDPFAMKEAENLAGGRTTATIYVLKKPKDAFNHPVLIQPLIGKRVFQVLDAVALS
jgi:hypothetical protein